MNNSPRFSPTHLSAWFLSTLLVGNPFPASAQDITVVGVIKGMDYIQENEDVARLGTFDHSYEPIFFETFVAVTPAGTGTTATVTPPGMTPLPLTGQGDELLVEHDYEKQAELDANFPNGTYQVVVSRLNDGQATFNVTMSPEDYPNPPRISNFSALQNVTDVSAAVTIQFDAFIGGTTADRIYFEICEENPFGGTGNCVYETDPLEVGAPDGTATQISIPPDTLQAGKRYIAGVGFAKVQSLDIATAPGVTAFGVFDKFTNFPLQTAGDDGQAPEFRTSRPFGGEVGVARNAVACFEFTEALDTSVGQTIGQSIQWTGLGGATINYQFSPDNKTVFAVFSQDLPAATQVQWTMNPSGAPNNIKDAHGNAFTDEFSGDFTTGSTTSTTDLDYFEMAKSEICCQIDNTGGVDSGLRCFSLEADLSAPNSVLSGTLTTSNGNVVSIGNSSGGDYFDYEAEYPSDSELDQFFPNSGANYQVMFARAHQGPITFPIAPPALDDYPTFPGPQPSLLNYDAAQSIDSAQPFTLQVSDFANGGSSDPVFIEIENDLQKFVLETPDPGEPGALSGDSGDGTKIEYTIPAGTLFPGRTYEMEVIYAKPQVLADSDGVERVFAFAKILIVEIQTQGPPMQPVATALPPGGGNFSLQYTGEPCRSYAIDASTDGLTWRSINDYPSPLGSSGMRTFVDWESPFFDTRLYRVREFPFQGGVLVQGRATNSLNSQGIQGAVISISIDPVQTALSDQFGNFTLPAQVNGNFGDVDYELRIEAPGFQTFSQTMNWGNFPGYQDYPLTPD